MNSFKRPASFFRCLNAPVDTRTDIYIVYLSRSMNIWLGTGVRVRFFSFHPARTVIRSTYQVEQSLMLERLSSFSFHPVTTMTVPPRSRGSSGCLETKTPGSKPASKSDFSLCTMRLAIQVQRFGARECIINLCSPC